nr:16S rRNA (guanine(966)-N(2))-methyltransferase RsmD [Planococcus lenghuensis]
MRVIAGQAKGIPLKAVPGIQTRPTGDKVKESVFNIIGPFFDGGTAIDLFAGSGGLGIEALSRGCEAAIFIDKSRKATETIQANLEKSRLSDGAQVYRTDAKKAISVMAKKGIKGHLLFLDPPYKDTAAYDLLDAAAESGVLTENAIAVCEHDKEVKLPDETVFFKLIKSSAYGSTIISIFRRKEIEEA